MKAMTALAAALTLAAFAGGASAQIAGPAPTPQVRVRYIVKDVPASVAFYKALGFTLDLQSGTWFAMLHRGEVRLLLSPQAGPGGASQPMPDGQRPAPGGWNRIVLDTRDIHGDVARLRQAGVHFRNAVVRGPGGSEILLDDPSGNPVELFQPG